jgi:phage terminase large subunit-like protein
VDQDLPRNTPYAECRGWDHAATEEELGKDPDWTVGVKMRRYPDDLYVVMHVVRDRWGPEEGDTMLATYVRIDGFDCKQREEQEPGASRKKVVASHERLLAA